MNENTTYIDRMKEEQKQLQERLSKLCGFMLTEAFFKLSPGNRILLEQQCEAMKRYRDILDVRIEFAEK